MQAANNFNICPPKRYDISFSNRVNCWLKLFLSVGSQMYARLPSLIQVKLTAQRRRCEFMSLRMNPSGLTRRPRLKYGKWRRPVNLHRINPDLINTPKALSNQSQLGFNGVRQDMHLRRQWRLFRDDPFWERTDVVNIANVFVRPIVRVTTANHSLVGDRVPIGVPV